LATLSQTVFEAASAGPAVAALMPMARATAAITPTMRLMMVEVDNA